jgi:hypothetical protein
LLLNALINNLLFVGLVDDAVALASDVLQRHSEHSFVVYQAHRALLWAGHVDEARRWAQVLRGSEFPVQNVYLVEIRQACAEGDLARAQRFFDKVLNIEDPDGSVHFIAMQIMSRPDEAHQLLIEKDLNIHELQSFMNYPYFDHRYFPELVESLERQGIERTFVEGPPYACVAD